MANEIVSEFTTGYTLYVCILKANGDIWNGSDWEDSNGYGWGPYGITMTEAPSGTYKASFPVDITQSGAYYIICYKQLGASPAESDEPVSTGIIQWTGIAEAAGDGASSIAFTVRFGAEGNRIRSGSR
jgi:hypothetical protein